MDYLLGRPSLAGGGTSLRALFKGGGGDMETNRSVLTGGGTSLRVLFKWVEDISSVLT